MAGKQALSKSGASDASSSWHLQDEISHLQEQANTERNETSYIVRHLPLWLLINGGVLWGGELLNTTDDGGA